MSTYLPQLFSLLSSTNGVPPKLSFSQVITFSLITIRLKEKLSWHQSSSTTDPPLSLPPNVVAFCSESLGTNNETIGSLWNYVREVVWNNGLGDEAQELLRNKTLLGCFLNYGVRHQIGECDMSIIAG